MRLILGVKIFKNIYFRVFFSESNDMSVYN